MEKESHTFLPTKNGKIEIYNKRYDLPDKRLEPMFSKDIIENCSIVKVEKNFKNYDEDYEIAICKDNKTNLLGILNNYGEIILDFLFDSIEINNDEKFPYDFIVIKENKKGYGAAYSHNLYIMEPKQEIVEFFDTYILIKDNDKYGIMSYENEVVTPCEYDNIISGNYEVAIAYNKNEIGFIDLSKPDKFIKFDYVLQKLNSEDNNSSLYFSKYNDEYILYYIKEYEKRKTLSIEVIKPDINLNNFRFYDKDSIDPEISAMIKTLITRVSKKEEK